jgi:hypothetical protein
MSKAIGRRISLQRLNTKSVQHCLATILRSSADFSTWT